MRARGDAKSPPVTCTMTRRERGPRRPLILHISADYPDPIRNRTTYAVKNFIDLLDDCDNVVVSLKRQSNPAKCYLHACEESQGKQVFAFGYWAPPGAICHRVIMRRVADRIGEIVTMLGRKPDLIAAHKLTIEGVIALHLHRKLGVPYVCAIRGEVESKLFRFKPELRGLFGDVIEQSQALFYVSAWFRNELHARYPGLSPSQHLLPNFTARKIRPTKMAWDHYALLTVLDLNMYRRKGFHHLLAAFARAHKVMPQLRLDVIGWANPRIAAHLRRRVARAGLGDAVQFLGAMAHEDVIGAMARYSALVLPARNETFGMVYVEALLSGIPILYTAGSGIDGYLDGLEVGARVTVGNVSDIANGLLVLVANAQHYRRCLLDQNRAIEARFSPPTYLEAFRALVCDATERNSAP